MVMVMGQCLVCDVAIGSNHYIVRMYVSAAGDHRGDGDGGNNERWKHQLSDVSLTPTNERSREREPSGNKTKHRACGVGELCCLVNFETFDERDARHASGEPGRDCEEVARCSEHGEPAARPEQRDEAPPDLEHGDSDEQSRKSGVFGMDANRAGVDDTSAERSSRSTCDSWQPIGHHRRRRHWQYGWFVGRHGVRHRYFLSIGNFGAVYDGATIKVLAGYMKRGARPSRSAATPSRYSSVFIASFIRRLESVIEAPTSWRSKSA